MMKKLSPSVIFERRLKREIKSFKDEVEAMFEVAYLGDSESEKVYDEFIKRYQALEDFKVVDEE